MPEPATGYRGPAIVYVVDDDADVRDGLQLLLSSCGWASQGFPSGEAFLDEYAQGIRGCLICDLQMPGIDGLDLQKRLRDTGCTLPIIFLTGHGDVPHAVRAMKDGAIDFLQKPFDGDRLLDLVRDALARSQADQAATERRDELVRSFDSLTARERDVAPLVVQGLANKVIAAELGISERTVEVHRSRIMRKMGARTLPDLVRMFAELANDPDPAS